MRQFIVNNIGNISHSEADDLMRIMQAKRIDDEIFTIKENIRTLKKDFENIKLEYEFLSSTEKLLEFQNLYFDDELAKKGINEIKIIDQSTKKLQINDLILGNE